jgi:hypothetical protein
MSFVNGLPIFAIRRASATLNKRPKNVSARAFSSPTGWEIFVHRRVIFVLFERECAASAAHESRVRRRTVMP